MSLCRYNPNTNLFYTYTTLFENRHAGGIPSETVRVVNLERFKGDLESVIVAGVEVCLFGYILFYMVIEARNIRRVGFSAWVTDGYSLIMYAFHFPAFFVNVLIVLSGLSSSASSLSSSYSKSFCLLLQQKCSQPMISEQSRSALSPSSFTTAKPSLTCKPSHIPHPHPLPPPPQTLLLTPLPPPPPPTATQSSCSCPGFASANTSTSSPQRHECSPKR